jgi:hypothetical protein
MPFKQMENLSMYTRGVKALGMHESDCFDTNDLFRGNDIGKVVQSIHAFGSLVRSKKLYAGPQLGVMHAQRNAREFTEAQIAEGRTATSKLTAGESPPRGGEGANHFVGSSSAMEPFRRFVFDYGEDARRRLGHHRESSLVHRPVELLRLRLLVPRRPRA